MGVRVGIMTPEQTSEILFQAVATAYFKLATAPGGQLPAVRDELVNALCDALIAVGVDPRNHQADVDQVKDALYHEYESASGERLAADFFGKPQ